MPMPSKQIEKLPAQRMGEEAGKMRILCCHGSYKRKCSGKKEGPTAVMSLRGQVREVTTALVGEWPLVAWQDDPSEVVSQAPWERTRWEWIVKKLKAMMDFIQDQMKACSTSCALSCGALFTDTFSHASIFSTSNTRHEIGGEPPNLVYPVGLLQLCWATLVASGLHPHSTSAQPAGTQQLGDCPGDGATLILCAPGAAGQSFPSHHI